MQSCSIEIYILSHDRLVPLVSLQKKVHMSILRKELPKLVALSSGTSNHQSLQNTVSEALAFFISVFSKSSSSSMPKARC